LITKGEHKMMDEKKVLKLTEDVMRAADAQERAHKGLEEARLRLADVTRSLDMAVTALNQFLGVK
jgi:hypothetical protein